MRAKPSLAREVSREGLSLKVKSSLRELSLGRHFRAKIGESFNGP
jgi:hypothetical protein